jgi:transposase-like protein
MTDPNDATLEPAGDDPSPSPRASWRRSGATLYTPELAEWILHEVQSGRPLLNVCRDDGIPAYATVYGWVVRDVEGFAGRYARARDIGCPRGAKASRYTAELAERILREVARGRSLHDVCRDDGMPPYRTVLGWTERHRDFAERCERARADGRPKPGSETIYTPEIAERILAALATGRTLHDICLDADLPAASTVYLWVSDNREGFAARYFQAREAGRGSMRRATRYTPELAERILYELADGRTLRDVCRADGMPAAATVRLWVAEDRDGFAARYHRASDLGHRDMQEELLEIVDDARNDWMERRARDGGRETVLNREAIQRSRLRYEARRWLLSNALPKSHGRQAKPEAKPDAKEFWADYIKLVSNKSRGLPSEDLPLDEAELEAFAKKYENIDVPPTDRL